MNLILNNRLHAGMPRLTDEEFSGLESKILAEGFREPIVCWNNVIVDGRHRYEICQKHNITFTTSSMSFANEDEATLWIIDNQLSKRNVTPFVRVELQQAKRIIWEEQGKENMISTLKKGDKPRFINIDKAVNTQKEIAKAADVSTGTVAKVDFILKNQTDVDSETLSDLRKGKKSVDKVYKEVKSKQYKAKEAKLKDITTVTIPVCDKYKLFNCDISKADIDDNSIDLILTDPPYPKEYLDCWQKLTQFASKKLKSGGSLIAFSGQQFFPQVLSNMQLGCTDGLQYYWMSAIKFPGNQTTDLWGVKCKNKWKPILWYVKGEYNNTFQTTDVYESLPEDVKSGQEFHKWGQSLPLMELLIHNFSYSGNTICDPFLGGGTTGVAAVKLKRKFIGVELDTDSFNLATKRIVEAANE